MKIKRELSRVRKPSRAFSVRRSSTQQRNRKPGSRSFTEPPLNHTEADPHLTDLRAEAEMDGGERDERVNSEGEDGVETLHPSRFGFQIKP